MSDPPPVLYCANHPNVETGLRCNNCSKPICARCAVLTPTGYRCRECLRSHQKKFDTALWYDYPLAIAAAAILSFLGSLLVPMMMFFILFIAPIVGEVITRAASLITRRRRSDKLFLAAAIAAALGGMPILLMQIANLLLGAGLMGNILSMVYQGLYVFLVTSTVYYRLKGIRIK